jgi:hypothetical protein
MPRSPYPLQWPAGRTRTKPDDRRASSFGGKWYDGKKVVSPYETAKQLFAELKRLGASHVVITSLLPTRHDGLPYSDGRCDDPGIAVWFVHRGHERVFACDRWRTPGENIRAITLSVEAMRGLERWGMADVVEQAFAGFAALPPGPPAKRSWREVLGVIDKPHGLMNDEYLAMVKHRHRKLIADAHPDVGGDTARAAELNAALDEAEKELAQP